MPHCSKSHVAAHSFCSVYSYFMRGSRKFTGEGGGSGVPDIVFINKLHRGGPTASQGESVPVFVKETYSHV